MTCEHLNVTADYDNPASAANCSYYEDPYTGAMTYFYKCVDCGAQIHRVHQ